MDIKNLAQVQQSEKKMYQRASSAVGVPRQSTMIMLTSAWVFQILSARPAPRKKFEGH